MNEENNHGQCAATNPPRFNWRKYKILRAIQWKIQSLMGRIGSATQKYDEHPNFNRFLAGIHSFAWTYFCGYGWKSAFRTLWIYWQPRFMR